MKVDKGRLAFTALLLIFALVIIITSLSYDPRARMVPILVGLATLIMGVPVVVNEIHPLRLLSKLDVSLMKEFGQGAPSEQPKEQVSGKGLLGLIAWVVGFFVLIFLVGFHGGMLIFTLSFIKVRGRASWPKAIIAAVVLWGIIFLMFEVAMGFRLFKGLFFGEILPGI